MHGDDRPLRETAAADRETPQTTNAYLAALVRASGDAIVGMTGDGTIQSWNPAAERMFGYTHTEAVGRPIALLTPPGYDAEQQAIMARLRAGDVVSVETMCRAKDGRAIYVQLNVAPVLDAADQLVLIAATLTDITERKRVEATLAEQARLLDLSNDAIIVRDVHNRIIYWNHGATELYGWTREEALGQDLHTFLRSEFEAPFEQLIIALQQYDRMEGEVVQVTRDGRRINVASRWALDRDAEGRPGAILTTYNDITERKRADAALRAREEWLRLVLESVQDYAIFTVDPAGRVMSWNEGAYQIKGYTTDEIVGQPMERFYTPEDVAAGKPAYDLETALREGRSEDERWRVRKDGSMFWANEVMAPLYADDGTHLGFTMICRDLTARKQAQEEVARALVAAQEARVIAEAAVQVRDQFLSIASHELRTPLTSLMGYAEILQTRMASEDNADAKTQRHLSLIARQAKRLNLLIGHLLDVTRLQHGQFALEQHVVELEAFVVQSVEEFRLTLPEDDRHTIVLAGPAESVEILGDPARLEEVLLNLLTNAVKYSPAGGTVMVRVTREADEAILDVEDQGIGIPAEAQARLFEAFYRAGNVSPQSVGFGIGLYVVHEIVKRHGGRIEVESSEGVGSRFRIVLPRHVSSR